MPKPDVGVAALRSICQKRDGQALNESSIREFINGFTNGDIPDYQMSALAMAIYLRGMNSSETAALTESMLRSGTVLQWHDHPPIVDKHSTGGIGDKVSLVLAPLLACCDVWVPMISGRGLGPTGGTLDKLESIRGFNPNLSLAEIQTITSKVGCVIAAASEDLAPADRKLYSLRDVTGTVASIPLITASIMSKKLAESLDGLVLDVKAGSGAFMKTLDEARKLAAALSETGNRMGVPTSVSVTNMNQPLGSMIGNAVEVKESLNCLRGGGPNDLRQLVIHLGGKLLAATSSLSLSTVAAKLADQLDSGNALERFNQMVVAQGGDPDHPLDIAAQHTLQSNRDGYVSAFECEQLGWSIIHMGGGRRQAGDSIDHRVGLEILVRVGDKVESGQPLMNVFADDYPNGRQQADLINSIQIQAEPVEPLPLIIDSN